MTTTKIIWSIILLALALSVVAIPDFHVKETDLVKVSPSATDANKDKIIYTFSAPINEMGEWQTNYGDAGEYWINITASDGFNQTTKSILLIVDKKNRPPVLKENKITVKETQTIDLKTVVEDPDKDILEFKFQKPFDNQGIWQTDYADEGLHAANFEVNDGEAKEEFRVEIKVSQTNQPPEVVDSFSEESTIILPEDYSLHYSIKAIDGDRDKLSYTWQLDGEVISQKDSDSYYFDFESQGNHSLIASISDGQASISQEWNVIVEKTNRAPKFTLLPMTVREGDTVKLALPKKDEDGDTLTYSYELPLSLKGEWKTTNEDQGSYTLTVAASDGELTTTNTVRIVVLDVDRAPVILAPTKINAWEGSPVNIKIESTDPDGDRVNVSFSQAPEGTVFKNNTLIWTPSYDTIKRSGSWISNQLNKLRIEYWFLSKEFPVTVTSCSKELCTSKTFKIVVKNINRAPIFTSETNVSVEETGMVYVPAQAFDPDGDILNYYFTSPAEKRSGRLTTSYDEAGTATVFVTATDGYAGVTQPVDVTVINKNRAPELIIRNDEITVNEGQQFTLPVSATDADSDAVTLTLKELPQGASFGNGAFVWQPGYNSVLQKSESSWNNLVSSFSFSNRRFNSEKETVWLEFSASDGQAEAMHPVKVTIKNVNRAPRIVDYLPNTETAATVGQPVVFSILGKDDDHDELTYKWSFGAGEDYILGAKTIERTFTTSGIKTVKVTVNDGRDSVTKEWKVQVMDKVVVAPVVPKPQVIPFTVRVYTIEG